MAASFSGLVKSVSGSLRNSVGIVSPSVRTPPACFIREVAVQVARRRRAYPLRRPLAGLLQFLDFTFDDFSFQRRHTVEKHNSIAMVRLMQHATRGQFRTVEFEFISI